MPWLPVHSLSGTNVPAAHAVCESYRDSASLFVAPAMANDNTTISIKQARFNPSEVITQPPHDAAKMISSFWKTSTDAATDGLHPVKGDSASATVTLPPQPLYLSRARTDSKSDEETTRSLLHGHPRDSSEPEPEPTFSYVKDIIGDIYDQCKHYAAFMANAHLGNSRRSKMRKKKKKKVP